MVVPLDLSIYVVDIAGKPFILILSIYLFKILVKRSINRKAALRFYYISMPRSVRLVVMVRSSCPKR